ncbi:purine and uridine phosphorylase [Cladorrhinum samala]|uniref:Purine and uridine phosphorylase n=1 Tax=Cladorrhinum samala TaxID=585594 RepID=A0AAV9HS45_9PEZI|nr:purine and uridine phosphorylase [Cladorrhinum samala]
MAEVVLRRHDFTAGWVSALPIELAAAQEMLDEEHEDYSIDLDDPSPYTFGRIGEQNVVLASLPGGQMGTNSAAAVAGQMIKDFPSLRFCLMVGTGGGVPNASADIRLGDVVVSQPHGNHGGVIQYDFGKAKPDKFDRTGFLNAPPTFLLTAVAKLEARRLRSKDNLSTHLSALTARLPRFSRDNAGPDRLFRPQYKHPSSNPTCDECAQEHLVDRPPRDRPTVVVHHGAVGSGNKLIRDGVSRDKLSSELGGVLCFEMEAAGLMNRFPCLVVRGISNYADSHKNKAWEPYAAAAAAAYAKELLLSITPPRLHSAPLESPQYPAPHARQLITLPLMQRSSPWSEQTREYATYSFGGT